jgi:hypothetical protein
MKYYWYNYFEAIPVDTIDTIVESCLKEKLYKGTISSKDGELADLKIRNSEINLLDANKYEELFQLIWKYALNSNKFCYGFDISNVENIKRSWGLYPVLLTNTDQLSSGTTPLMLLLP